MKVEGDVEFKRACRKVIEQFPEQGALFVRGRLNELRKRTRNKTNIGPAKKLKKSWQVQNPTKSKVAKGIIEGEVKSTAPHAHLFEYGHRQTKEKGGPEIGPPVKGRFPLTSSLEEINSNFEDDLRAWLHGLTKEINL